MKHLNLIRLARGVLRVGLLTLSLLALSVVGCQQDPASPAGRQPSLMTLEGCEISSCGGGVDGSITESPGGLPCCQGPDPSPGAPGLWITWEAHDCYLNYSDRIGWDADQDLLDDDCEYALAKAFAPMLSISTKDACPRGEPYWSVRYFDDRWNVGWGQFVRIGYMPAYYRDCGTTYAHDGDSEFIMLRVGFNAKTRHWELVRGWLSAHSNENQLNINNNSDWVNAPDLEYPSRVPRSFPRVYVSELKHGNYKSRERCNTAGPINYDDCTWNRDVGRIKVMRSHNIGGYDHQLVNCTRSQNAIFWDNHVLECFWGGKSDFEGWQGSTGTGGMAHRSYLMSGAFECWLYDGFHCYYGP